MPKMKTDKTVAKRFRKTGTGKIVHVKRNKRHILTKKTAKRKRQLRGIAVLDKTEKIKYIKQALDH